MRTARYRGKVSRYDTIAQDLRCGLEDLTHLCHNNDFGIVAYFDADVTHLIVHIKREKFDVEFTLPINGRMLFTTRLKAEVRMVTRSVQEQIDGDHRSPRERQAETRNLINSQWISDLPDETPPNMSTY